MRIGGPAIAEFELVKAGQVEVKPRFAQLADFEREHLEIPAGVERQLVELARSYGVGKSTISRLTA